MFPCSFTQIYVCHSPGLNPNLESTLVVLKLDLNFPHKSKPVINDSHRHHQNNSWMLLEPYSSTRSKACESFKLESAEQSKTVLAAMLTHTTVNNVH